MKAILTHRNGGDRCWECPAELLRRRMRWLRKCTEQRPQSRRRPLPAMPHFRFENFTTANGLPDNHVFTVLVDGDRIWAGTENGLGLYENHQWKTYTTKDGLAHRAVLSLALDKRTGDVWAGTMGGLSRISGGRIDTFTQLNSGLSNDVVYGVSVEGENVWVATAAGGVQARSAHRTVVALQRTQHADGEIWVYGVAATPTKVYYAVWGSGVLEYDQQKKLLGQVRRSRRRDRDGAVQGSGVDPRDYDFGQLCGQYSFGWLRTLATAGTTAATGTTS